MTCIVIISTATVQQVVASDEPCNGGGDSPLEQSHATRKNGQGEGATSYHRLSETLSVLWQEYVVGQSSNEHEIVGPKKESLTLSRCGRTCPSHL